MANRNLNPYGNQKTRANEVKREIKTFEAKYIQEICNQQNEIAKIYECEESNWNLFLLKRGYFLSIPKKENHCSPSTYGSIEHTEKFNILKDL